MVGIVPSERFEPVYASALMFDGGIKRVVEDWLAIVIGAGLALVSIAYGLVKRLVVGKKLLRLFELLLTVEAGSVIFGGAR